MEASEAEEVSEEVVVAEAPGDKLHLIIGIDPGTTTGISALNLNGKLIKIINMRNAGKSEVIKQILEIGTPSIIATDKKPCPDSVLKIAASFNIRLFVPKKELSQEEKKRIIKEQNIKVENNHERDAYSAAYKAYHEFSNRLQQIENKIEFIEKERDYLKHLVLNGHSLNNAILFLKKPVENIEKEIKTKPTTKEKTIETFIFEIKTLSNKNQELKKSVERLKIEKTSLELIINHEKNERKKEIEKNKEVIRLKNEIIRLKLYIENTKKKKKPKKKQKKDNRKYLKNLVENIITEYRDKRKKELN